MKIIDILKEQEETPNNLQVIDGGAYNIVKKLDEFMEILKEKAWRISNNTFISPDGTFKFFGSPYQHKPQDDKLTLEMKVYVTLITVDQIPNDFLEFISETIYNEFEKWIPEMFEFIKSDDYPPNTFNFSFRDVYVSYKETFIGLYDHMDRAYYNTHITNLVPLEGMVQHNYTLDPDQLPVFGDGFGLAAERELKKVKSIYKGFRRGSFKGHTFEFTENNPRIHIHLANNQDGQRVIQPHFKTSINAGYIRIDGKKTGGFSWPPEEEFLDKPYIKELNDYLKERFQQFNIKLI